MKVTEGKLHIRIESLWTCSLFGTENKEKWKYKKNNYTQY